MWRVLLLAAGVLLFVRALMEIRLVAVPLLVGLLLAALLAPAVLALRSRGTPAVIAVIAILGGALLVAAAGVAVIVPAVAAELDDVRDSAAEGAERISRWAAELGLAETASGDVADDIANAIRENADALGSGAATGALIVAEIVAGVLLCVVLTFFLLKDGEGMWRWALDRLPPSRVADAEQLGPRVWDSLGAYVRGLVVVAAFDAVFIALGLWVIGVPLVLPLAVLTFVGAFVPVLGAIVAGAVAALVALVSGGVDDMVLVIVVVLVVQQVESNVLHPIVMGRALPLHPMAVLLAVTTGGVLGGVIGAALATPIAATAVLAAGFARRRGAYLDGRGGDRRGERFPAPRESGQVIES
jgi:predicted PurR-regulated permease PerM